MWVGGVCGGRPGGWEGGRSVVALRTWRCGMTGAGGKALCGCRRRKKGAAVRLHPAAHPPRHATPRHAPLGSSMCAWSPPCPGRRQSHPPDSCTRPSCSTRGEVGARASVAAAGCRPPLPRPGGWPALTGAGPRGAVRPGLVPGQAARCCPAAATLIKAPLLPPTPLGHCSHPAPPARPLLATWGPDAAPGGLSRPQCAASCCQQLYSTPHASPRPMRTRPRPRPQGPAFLARRA